MAPPQDLPTTRTPRAANPAAGGAMPRAVERGVAGFVLGGRPIDCCTGLDGLDGEGGARDGAIVTVGVEEVRER